MLLGLVKNIVVCGSDPPKGMHLLWIWTLVQHTFQWSKHRLPLHTFEIVDNVNKF